MSQSLQPVRPGPNPEPGAAGTSTRPGIQAPNAWRVLTLLALANVLNFYDRALPAVLVEEAKDEFGINDLQIGVLSASFIVVYAVAGIALGRMADRRSRRMIMGCGLLVWSVLTAASGGVWSFTSLLVVRLGIGVGEAAYAPAANSTISDLFPAEKRSRAVAIFQLGIPVGLILAFFTTGFIVDIFDTWRAPFFLAAGPGIVLALAMLRMREPERGAAEADPGAVVEESVERPSTREVIRSIVRVRTMRWLILAGIGLQLAGTSISTFLIPLFQRYFDMSLTQAGISGGVVLGFSGILGLLVGGLLADRASRTSTRRRVLVGAVALLAAAPISLVALSLGPDSAGIFIAVMFLAWSLQFFFQTSALPAVSDVIDPAHRSTAIAVFFAAFYLFGGAFGPIVTGILSDALSHGTPPAGMTGEAQGLHLSLLIMVPVSLVLTAFGLFGAARHVGHDQVAMRERIEAA